MKVVTLLFLLVMSMATPRSYSEEGMNYQAQNDMGSAMESEEVAVEEEEVIPTDEEESGETVNSAEEF